MILTLSTAQWMFRLARICAAGPGESFFFGGFDLRFGEGWAVFASGFGAETKRALGLKL
jgi:hypothetical protein